VLCSIIMIGFRGLQNILGRGEGRHGCSSGVGGLEPLGVSYVSSSDCKCSFPNLIENVPNSSSTLYFSVKMT
jgi:hypothetical protein